MVRRAYFKKAFDENIQEILIKRKKKENAKFCNATGKPNLFKLDLDDHDDDDDDDDVDNEKKKKVAFNLKAKDTLSEEEVLLGRAVQKFRQHLKRTFNNKTYDPMQLKNRMELIDKGYSALTSTEKSSNTEQSELNQIGIDLSQTFGGLFLRMMLMKQVVDVTQEQLSIFLTNSREWMGLGRFNEPALFNMNNLALRIIEGDVHFGQQSRSQALNSINKISIYSFEDDYKREERELLLSLNLQATNSLDFIDLSRKKLRRLQTKYQGEGENFESSQDDINLNQSDSIETDLDDVVESAERELKRQKPKSIL